MGRTQKTRKWPGARDEKDTKHSKLQKMLEYLSVALLAIAGPLSTPFTNKDIVSDLARDEPGREDPCSDSIKDLLVMQKQCS